MQFTSLMEAADLRARFGAEDWVILDCRFDLTDPQSGRRSYQSAHIPGARYVDLNRELSAPVGAASGRHPLPDPLQFASQVASWGIGTRTQVIVYDDASGLFAARAWWMLRWIGAQAVAVLNGGLAAWRACGGPMESGIAAPRPPARFVPTLHPHWVMTSEQVVAALQRPDTVLVDARAPERFSGAVEPLDPIAGHVPGAINAPFARHVHADGRLLDADVLRTRWGEILGGADPRSVISMCGSGVTACHNLLSLELAGLPGAALYAGSWSEWIADPARPVARSDRA